MSLNNIKAKQAERGFTIVELLIVIVVIGILAAITLVSYNGITTRANAASAKATAATIQKKVELYQADGPTGKYPVAAADLTGAAADESYAVSAGNPAFAYSNVPQNTSGNEVTASNGTSRVSVRMCSATDVPQDEISTSNITGLEIFFWDYDAGTITAAPVEVGDTTNCSALAT
jgi:prepilin-type N-terminal cleavage/methylation domain-containing protein